MYKHWDQAMLYKRSKVIFNNLILSHLLFVIILAMFSTVNSLMLRNAYELSPLISRLFPWGLMWNQSPIDRVWQDNHNILTTNSHQGTRCLGTYPHDQEPITVFFHGEGPAQCKAGSAQESHVCQTDPYPVERAWPVCSKYLLMVQSKPGKWPEDNEVAGVVVWSSWSSVALPDTEFLPLAKLLWLVRLTFPS